MTKLSQDLTQSTQDPAQQVKLYKSLTELHEWKKNPRSITDKGLENLKYKLKTHKLLKPLLITKDGTVVGGNMRLRAMRELGYEQAWVEIVEPQDEKEMIEIALADNDHDGYYLEGDLSTLLESWKPEDLSHYTADFGTPMSLEEFMAQGSPASITEEELKPYKKTHVLLSFDPKLMDKLSELLEQIRSVEGVEYETGSN